VLCWCCCSPRRPLPPSCHRHRHLPVRFFFNECGVVVGCWCWCCAGVVVPLVVRCLLVVVVVVAFLFVLSLSLVLSSSLSPCYAVRRRCCPSLAVRCCRCPSVICRRLSSLSPHCDCWGGGCALLHRPFSSPFYGCWGGGCALLRRPFSSPFFFVVVGVVVVLSFVVRSRRLFVTPTAFVCCCYCC